MLIEQSKLYFPEIMNAYHVDYREIAAVMQDVVKQTCFPETASARDRFLRCILEFAEQAKDSDARQAVFRAASERWDLLDMEGWL